MLEAPIETVVSTDRTSPLLKEPVAAIGRGFIACAATLKD
jgi:hypothetical protein